MTTIDVIYNIFGEEDIAVMPEDILGTMYPLVDKYLAGLFEDFLENPEGNPKAKENIQKCLGKKISSYSLPKKLQADGTLSLIQSLNVYNLAESPLDYDKCIETLEYIDKIRDDLKPYTEPRSKEDFDVFLNSIKTFDATVKSGRKYSNCAARVKINKDMFYRPREKSVPTPVKSIVNKADQIEMLIKGLRYLKYCNENGVDQTIRRNF